MSETSLVKSSHPQPNQPEQDGTGGGGAAHQRPSPKVTEAPPPPPPSIIMWPVGSVAVNGLAAAEWGAGLTLAVSRLVNWPTAGSYQRADMSTRPLAGSVHPDW